MTAIAILNAESDPHLIADTLLVCQGEDSRSGKTVWLPSRGNIDSATIF